MDPRLIPMLFDYGDFQINEPAQVVDSPGARFATYYFQMMSA